MTQQNEPVTWESVLGTVARGWCYEENANKTMDFELAVAIAKEVHALYTTPQQRKPLTDDEIAELWLPIYASTPPSGIHEDGLMPWRLSRAVEAAHGIKE